MYSVQFSFYYVYISSFLLIFYVFFSFIFIFLLCFILCFIFLLYNRGVGCYEKLIKCRYSFCVRTNTKHTWFEQACTAEYLHLPSFSLSSSSFSFSFNSHFSSSCSSPSSLPVFFSLPSSHFSFPSLPVLPLLLILLPPLLLPSFVLVLLPLLPPSSPRREKLPHESQGSHLSLYMARSVT